MKLITLPCLLTVIGYGSLWGSYAEVSRRSMVNDEALMNLLRDEKRLEKLSQAVQVGNVWMVIECLKDGADIDLDMEKRKKLIQAAFEKGYVKCAKILRLRNKRDDYALELTKNDIENNRRSRGWDDEKNMRLYQAVLDGDAPMVIRSIQEGADINLRIEEGKTLIHVAFERGHISCAQILLDKVERDRLTAPLERRLEEEESLINMWWNWFRNMRLYQAVIVGDAPMVIQCIQEGADVNFRVEEGKTLIHVALEGGHLQCAHILFQPEQYLGNFQEE